MLLDISMPITAGAVFRRGSPPVEIASRQFHHEAEGTYETIILTLPAHTATHIDLVYETRRVPPECMIGPGRLYDVTNVTTAPIRVADVAPQGTPRPGEFVFFRTDWSQFAGTPQYYDHPELAAEVIDWLIAHQVNAVGIDALGLGRDRRHSTYDRLLAQQDIFVIENLTNLAAVPRREFTVYCLPLSIENVDAIPARVLLECRDS